MTGRIAVLNIMLAGLLVAGYFLGILADLWAMDKFYAIPATWGMVVLGTVMVFRNALAGATWLVDRIPAVGMLLTVTGLLWASNGDLGADAFKRDVIHSLVGNFAGVAGWLWLDLLIKVKKKEG